MLRCHHKVLSSSENYLSLLNNSCLKRSSVFCLQSSYLGIRLPPFDVFLTFVLSAESFLYPMFFLFFFSFDMMLLSNSWCWIRVSSITFKWCTISTFLLSQTGKCSQYIMTTSELHKIFGSKGKIGVNFLFSESLSKA